MNFFPYFWGLNHISMNIPEGLLYTQDHEWIKIEGAKATIGITDFAQGELGDIVYIDIPTVGQEVGEHQIFGSVEAVKTVSDLFMPAADHPVYASQFPLVSGISVSMVVPGLSFLV